MLGKVANYCMLAYLSGLSHDAASICLVVHNPAVEYTFQVTKLVELNIKRLLYSKPISTISEQTAMDAYMHAWLVTPLSRKSPYILTNSCCPLNEGS